MPEHIKYEDDDLFNPETHHESSDVPVRPLLWFIVGFIVFGIVTHMVVLFFYKALASAERNRMDPPHTQVARPADSGVPKNQPLLQPFPRQDGERRVIPPNRNTPVTDMADMRRSEDEVLRNHGWVDEQKGIARIPIEDAKKLYAAKMAVAGQTSAVTTTAAVPAPAPATAPGAPASLPAGPPASSRPPEGARP
jgi:hypothetical protein